MIGGRDPNPSPLPFAGLSKPVGVRRSHLCVAAGGRPGVWPGAIAEKCGREFSKQEETQMAAVVKKAVAKKPAAKKAVAKKAVVKKAVVKKAVVKKAVVKKAVVKKAVAKKPAAKKAAAKK
jgi:hypothetical protein